MKNGRHIAEFYGVGVMLAIVGGYLDAYTYISRDHVFFFLRMHRQVTWCCWLSISKREAG